MHKKNRYIFICIPFIIGGLLFSFGVYNLVSSLLFFVGGYVALKKIFDYKKILKKREANTSIPLTTKNNYQKDYSYRNSEHIIGLKRTRRYSRVRRKY